MRQYDYDVTFDGLLSGKIKRKKRRGPLLYAVIVIVLLITLALLLGGCSQHILTLPDGSTYKANRFLDSTKIGSVSYDDGSFTLDGYESDLTRALGIIDRLIAREEVGP